MYKPSVFFKRTAEQRRDPFLSWARDDQSFFAAGACHILAAMFQQLHHGEGYEMIHIKPHEGFSGNHVYMTNGTWAFDHNGWTKEEELLEITKREYRKEFQDWNYERIVIPDDHESYWKEINHRLPYQFAYLPWERAYSYIKKFDSNPPAA